jgi:hypothetical protein
MTVNRKTLEKLGRFLLRGLRIGPSSVSIVELLRNDFLTAVRMPGRPKNSLGPLVLFHGCDKDVAESVLSGEATLQPS